MSSEIYSWRRHGGYEVSTRGDHRFSAFCAILPDGRSIEMHYQCDVKGYEPGGRNWRLGKGKPPLDRNMNLQARYFDLWRTWAQHHPALMAELRIHALAHGGILSDRFATTPINQAHALAALLAIGWED